MSDKSKPPLPTPPTDTKQTKAISLTPCFTPVNDSFYAKAIQTSDSISKYLSQNKYIIEHINNAQTSGSSLYSDLHLSAYKEIADLSLSPHLEQIKQLQAPINAFVDAANMSMQRLYADAELLQRSFTDEALKPAKDWLEQTSLLPEVLATIPKYDFLVHAHLADISKFSLLSELNLSAIAWNNVGDALAAKSETQALLQTSFTELTKSYSALFKVFENDPKMLMTLPPAVSRLPAIEYYNDVNVIDSITIPSGILLHDFAQDKRIKAEVQHETADDLDALINRLDPHLLPMLKGARLSLTSTNPDRVRHFTVSLRELYTHVLHALAPDSNIRTWSRDPEYFANGKPTRKARMLYICRSVQSEEFSTFVEKDVDAALELLQLFQRGTHNLEVRYNDTQLRAMLLRMESLLKFMLVL